MRLRLFAVLLPLLQLTPAHGQAPPPPPPGWVGPAPLPRFLPPLPPRLVAGTVVQEYLVTYFGPVPPGPVIASDWRVNRMRVTTIRPLPPPPPPPLPPPPFPPPPKALPKDKEAPKEKKEAASAAVQTLHVKKWTAGRLIEEEDGRRWVLVHGAPIVNGPAEIDGWQLPSETDVPTFYTRSGRLFRMVTSK